MIWQNSEVIIYISFSFLFLFGLITQGRSVGKYHMTMSQSQSHDEHGKIVHRPCSSCISHVQNLIGTPLSFFFFFFFKLSVYYMGHRGRPW